jgi:hypothetical protein
VSSVKNVDQYRVSRSDASTSRERGLRGRVSLTDRELEPLESSP